VKILRDEGFGEDGGKAVGGNGGVVHSFTGTAEEVAELVCTDHWLVIHRLNDFPGTNGIPHQVASIPRALDS